MENKLFESNNEKKKYEVVIEVYENCAMTKVQTEVGKPFQISYHELIGVLETQKQHLIWQQREVNMKKAKVQTGKKNGR